MTISTNIYPRSFVEKQSTYTGFSIRICSRNTETYAQDDILMENCRCSVEAFYNTSIHKFIKEKVTIVLHGDLVSGKLSPLFVSQFRVNPIEASKSLNGSWSLVFFDSERSQIFVVTDRVNSRPVFINTNINNGSDIYINTSLNYFSLDFRKPDWTGIGWMLANGIIHCNRSIFENVNKLKRASVHKITSKTINSEKYWDYEFTNDFSGRSITSLKADFGDLLRLAVKRRISNNGPSLLSLSAGYDATCILGILAKERKPDEIISFSYELPISSQASDAMVSRTMAQKYGIPHHIFHSYDGNFSRALQLNILNGDGYANFCDEILAWDQIRNRFPSGSTLFVGDECFGWGKHRTFHSTDDVLEICGIRNADGLSYLNRMFPPAHVKEMMEGVRSDITNLISTFPSGCYEDQRDYLYLDQRIGNLLTPWRTCMSGRTFRLQNPWLDNDILDFVRHLPSDYRDNKRLYRQTCTEMFPDLFSLHRARSANYSPDWKSEISHHKNSILDVFRQLGSPAALEWQTDSFIDMANIFGSSQITDVYGNLFRKGIRYLGRRIPFLGSISKRYLSPRTDLHRVLLRSACILGAVGNLSFSKRSLSVSPPSISPISRIALREEEGILQYSQEIPPK